MTDRVLNLILGPGLKVELNVATLQMKVTTDTETKVPEDTDEYKMVLGMESLHFFPLSKTEGMYDKTNDALYRKQITTSYNTTGLSILGLPPLVVKILLSSIRRLKDNSTLSPMTIDIPELTKSFNEFVNGKVTEVVKKNTKGSE